MKWRFFRNGAALYFLSSEPIGGGIYKHIKVMLPRNDAEVSESYRAAVEAGMRRAQTLSGLDELVSVDWDSQELGQPRDD